MLGDLPQVLFMIVGGGAKGDAMAEKARTMGLDNIRFYPMQPSQLAPHVYSMADINLIPLAPGVTGTAFPSKTAICCAMARPVIASVDEDSHYAKILDGCDGCKAVPAGDVKALAQAIRDLYARGAQQRCPGLTSLYQGFLSRERCLAQHIKLFEGR